MHVWITSLPAAQFDLPQLRLLLHHWCVNQDTLHHRTAAYIRNTRVTFQCPSLSNPHIIWHQHKPDELSSCQNTTTLQVTTPTTPFSLSSKRKFIVSCHSPIIPNNPNREWRPSTKNLLPICSLTPHPGPPMVDRPQPLHRLTTLSSEVRFSWSPSGRSNVFTTKEEFGVSTNTMLAGID